MNIYLIGNIFISSFTVANTFEMFHIIAIKLIKVI
jgi:hypothetical protein